MDDQTLEDIKRLLIFQLYREGASTSEIGGVLGVSYKTIERILPSRKGRILKQHGKKKKSKQ